MDSEKNANLRRQFQRIWAKTPIRLELDGGHRFSGLTVNVCLNGVFVDLPAIVADFSQSQSLKLYLSSDESSAVLNGRVVHQKHAGVGIALHEDPITVGRIFEAVLFGDSPFLHGIELLPGEMCPSTLHKRDGMRITSLLTCLSGKAMFFRVRGEAAALTEGEHLDLLIHPPGHGTVQLSGVVQSLRHVTEFAPHNNLEVAVLFSRANPVVFSQINKLIYTLQQSRRKLSAILLRSSAHYALFSEGDISPVEKSVVKKNLIRFFGYLGRG